MKCMMARNTSAMFLLLLAYPFAALAGPVESPGGSDAQPGDTDVRVVRYDYSGGGFLLSNDGGSSWRLMCNNHIDASVRRETTGVVIGADGSIYTGASDGMWRGSADGCSWERIDTFEGKWVKDIVRHPGDPEVLFAITSNGGDVENGIYRHDAATDSWAAMGTQEPVLIRALRITQLDGGALRFHESIARGTLAGGTSPNYIVRHSDDDGATWTEHAFGEAGGTLALLGVDPTDADRIAISIDREGDSDSVQVSAEAGADGSWVEVLTPDEFGGGAFGPEGQLWLGDAEGGLYVVDKMASDATTLNGELRPRCVEYHAQTDELVTCGLFVWGPVDTASGEQTPLLDLRTQDAWLECDGQSVATTCESNVGVGGWCGPTHYPEAPICEDYGYPGISAPEPDGGLIDSGSDGGADGSAGDDSSGCSCRTVGPPAATGHTSLLWLLALPLLVVRLRRQVLAAKR